MLRASPGHGRWRIVGYSETGPLPATWLPMRQCDLLLRWPFVLPAGGIIAWPEIRSAFC
jgi:hypothetical protein